MEKQYSEKSRKKNSLKRFLAHRSPFPKTTKMVDGCYKKMRKVVTKRIMCIRTSDVKDWIEIVVSDGSFAYAKTSLTKFQKKFPRFIRAADYALINPDCVHSVSTPTGLQVLYLRDDSWDYNISDIVIRTGEKYRDHLRFILPPYVDFDM